MAAEPNLNAYPLTISIQDFDAVEQKVIQERANRATKEYWATSEFRPEDFCLEGSPVPTEEELYKEDEQRKFNSINLNVFRHYFPEFSQITEHEISIHNKGKRKYPLKCLIRLIQDLPENCQINKLILSHEDYIRLFDPKFNSEKNHKELCELFLTVLKNSPIKQVILRDINHCALLGRNWDPFITGVLIDDVHFGIQGLLTLCEFLSKTPSVTTFNMQYPIHERKIDVKTKHFHYQKTIEETIHGTDIFGTNGLSLFGQALLKTGINQLAIRNVGIGAIHPNEAIRFFASLKSSKITSLIFNNCQLGKLNSVNSINSDSMDTFKALGLALIGLESLVIIDPEFAATLQNCGALSQFAECIKASRIHSLTLEIFSSGIVDARFNNKPMVPRSFSSHAECKAHMDWLNRDENDRRIKEILEFFKMILSNPLIKSLKVPCLEFYNPKPESQNANEENICQFFRLFHESQIRELMIPKRLFYVNNDCAKIIAKILSENHTLEKISTFEGGSCILPNKEQSEGLELLKHAMNELIARNQYKESMAAFLMGIHPKLGLHSKAMICETDHARTRQHIPIIFQFAGFCTNAKESVEESADNQDAFMNKA